MGIKRGENKMNKKFLIKKHLVILIGLILITTTFISTPTFAENNKANLKLVLNEENENIITNPIKEKSSTNEFSIKTIFNTIKEYFQLGILGSRIYTSCNGVEKYTDATFGIFNDIDADDDSNTGDNGIDLSIQYLLLPWIEFEPYLTIGVMLTISVERTGDEIKDKDLTIKMLIGENDLAIGQNERY